MGSGSEYFGLVLESCRYPLRTVLALFWNCFDGVLELSWHWFGIVLASLLNCVGIALELFKVCFEIVLVLLWNYFGTFLECCCVMWKLCWHCFGLIWGSFFNYFGFSLVQSSEDRLVHSSSLSARIDMMQLFGRRHADLISSMSNFTFPVFLMTRQRLRRHLQLAPLLLRAHSKQEAIRTALQTSYLTLLEQAGA